MPSRMGVRPTYLWFLLVFVVARLPATQQDAKKKDKKMDREIISSQEIPRETDERGREGLRCYKCDPTDNNNYCRDFKPRLATPYDCALAPESAHSKTAKSPSPLGVVINADVPFSCYKIKADVAYGHGKVFGAKRYGCGHVMKVRTVEVRTGETGCANARMTAKGKDFFDGIVCNCDNADGCNAAGRRSFITANTILACVFLVCLSLFRI